MDFADKIQEISSHIPEKLPNIQSEETTKTVLVLPFIQALGYDIFDPKEVKGEFTLDMGGVKADRIDYAIFKDNDAKILIECKSCDTDLNKATFKQLKKYFAFTNAKFGILTNGLKYRFFSDLENPGKMDDAPFLELDLLNVKDPVVARVKTFSNPIDEKKASEIADELKCKSEIRAILEREFNKPSKEFVSFFASQVHKGRLVKDVVKQFCSYTKETCDQFIQDKIDETFEAAGYHRHASLNLSTEPEDKKKYFVFNGEKFEIKFWKDMLPKICAIMASRHKERVEELFSIKGDKHPYFSRNPQELKSPELIEGTDIYVATAYAKGMLLTIARDVVTLFGYLEDIISYGEGPE